MQHQVTLLLIQMGLVGLLVSGLEQAQQAPQMIRSVNPSAKLVVHPNDNERGEPPDMIKQLLQQDQINTLKSMAALLHYHRNHGHQGQVANSHHVQAGPMSPPDNYNNDDAEDRHPSSELLDQISTNGDQIRLLQALAPLKEQPQQVDKRSWTPRARSSQFTTATTSGQDNDKMKQEEVIAKLLDELAVLDIDPSSTSRYSSNQGASNNRLRGRSTFLLGGEPGTQQIAQFQSGETARGAMGVQAGPKRTTNRHVPCFFNAITCF